MARGANFYSDEYKLAADLYTPLDYSKDVARKALAIAPASAVKRFG